MKKLMFAAAVLTAGFAMAESIESTQIVGYVQAGSADANQYVPLATQFEALGGGDIAVKSAVTVDKPVANATWSSADQIWRWNTANATWVKYAYYENARFGIDPNWRKIVNDKVEDHETLETIPAGETFFFLRSAAAKEATLTLAGGVKDLSGETSFAVTKNQLAFVANPWPTEIVIKDFIQFVAEGELVSNATWSSADQIWLWDTANATWIKYAYYENARFGIDPNWRKIVNDKVEDRETLETIPAGKGIFFQRSGAASETEPLKVTFKIPEAK